MKRVLHISLTAVTLLLGCSDNLTMPPERAPYASMEPAPLECVPNLDGTIAGDELIVGFDTPVSYRINPADEPRAVDLVGLVDQNDERVWDWSQDTNDQEIQVVASSPSDRWYADAFPDGEFVASLDAAGLVEGIYKRTSAGVFLLGYASPEEMPSEGQTLVTYTEPVAIYRLPLEVGDEWISVGEVRNSIVRDLPYAGRDVYTNRVDAVGELWLPELRFDQVLRVRTDLTVEPSVGVGFTRKQVGYVFECFGEVARAVSADNETDDNFDTAVEIRRIGL